jgi:hypothetical protein
VADDAGGLSVCQSGNGGARISTNQNAGIMDALSRLREEDGADSISLLNTSSLQYEFS